MTESSIIQKYFLPLTYGKEEALKLADDVAYFSCFNGEKIVISQDSITENVHFLTQNSPKEIAYRLLLTNLSDLASSGALPRYYLLSCFFTKNIDENWIKDFASGLKEISDKYNIALIGGDTVVNSVANHHLSFSLTIIGSCKKEEIITRCGAQDKDIIWVSGYIGDSFLGLKILQNKKITSNSELRQYLINKYSMPNARVELGLALRGIATAMIDISDGLALDLRRLMTTSCKTGNLFLNKIPISPHAKNAIDSSSYDIKDLIAAGDDYELLFTAPPDQTAKIQAIAKDLNINITEIGCVNALDGVINVYDENNLLIHLEKEGYDHVAS